MSGRPRRLSVTGYVEWVLGDLKPKTTMHVVTEVDTKSGALLARNSYNTEFPDRVAFFDVDDPGRTVSGDRTEFIGRNGSLRSPAAMSRIRLSGKVGAGARSLRGAAGAVRARRGEEREIVFRLGVGRNAADAASLLQRFRGSPRRARALERCAATGSRRSRGSRRDARPSLDILANGWLVYQTLACRCGRAAATTSRAARSASATSCRTRWRSCMRAALLRAQSAALRRRQFVEATCSTGGIRPRPRRAHALLGRLSVAAARGGALRRGDRRPRRARRVVAFLDGRR
jgi:cellobiose phosphorylase